MGTFTVSLIMSRVDFTLLDNVEIRFEEDGVLRPLDLNEWKAYFPGCGDPKAYRRTAAGNEVVFTKTITDRLTDMIVEAGWAIQIGEWPVSEVARSLTRVHERVAMEASSLQRRFGPSAEDDDRDPPTSFLLLDFMRELNRAIAYHPHARMKVEHTTRPPSLISQTLAVGGATVGSSSLAGTPGNAQIWALTLTDIRRSYDRGEIDETQYTRIVRDFTNRNIR